MTLALSVRWRVMVLCAATALAACSTDGPGTGVRLLIGLETRWNLDALRISAAERTQDSAVSQELLVQIPDDWDGREITITVSGLRAGELIATGRQRVTIEAGAVVSATLALVRVPCGAFCSEGSTLCDGDAFRTCHRDEEGCMQAGEPSACPGDRPYCSHGECGATCAHECAEGEERCAGFGAAQACGQADSDPCLDWLPVSPCTDGTVCSAGACRPTGQCADECTEDVAECRGQGTVRCDDRNADGCLEWGATEPCGPEQHCSDGACRSGACADECTDSACSELSFRQCDNFDLDSCRELSPGTSCVPEDPCRVGICRSTGCDTEPMICSTPDPPACRDERTLRHFQTRGSCSASGCDYDFEDTECPGGCQDGACVECGSTVVSDDVHWLTTVTMEADDEGNLHVAYGSNGALHYLRRGPAGTWVKEQAYEAEDTTDPLTGARIRLDEAGAVHVGFFVEVAGATQLMYAVRVAAGTWSTQLVDPEIVGRRRTTALAVESDGAAHLLYRLDSPDTTFRYAHKPRDGDWTISEADPGMHGYGPTLAVDDSGGLHAAWESRPSGLGATLEYGHRSRGGDWQVERVDGDDYPAGRNPTITLDGVGRPHISYYSDAHEGLLYASRPIDRRWAAQSIDVADDVGEVSDIVVGGRGLMYIAYNDKTYDNLKLARRQPGPAGIWTFGTIDAEGAGGNSPTVALDAAGRVHAIHVDAATNTLRHVIPCDF